MIKNKELLELIKFKENSVNCEKCKHCNERAYHSGKWYCNKLSVTSVPVDIEMCFEN